MVRECVIEMWLCVRVYKYPECKREWMCVGRCTCRACVWMSVHASVWAWWAPYLPVSDSLQVVNVWIIQENLLPHLHKCCKLWSEVNLAPELMICASDMMFVNGWFWRKNTGTSVLVNDTVFLLGLYQMSFFSSIQSCFWDFLNEASNVCHHVLWHLTPPQKKKSIIYLTDWMFFL